MTDEAIKNRLGSGTRTHYTSPRPLARPLTLRLKILAIHANTGARFYRIIPQLKWMQAQGHEARLERHDAPHLPQMVEWADVVILQSVFNIELARAARAAGKTVFFEFDDLMHRSHEKHYAYEETRGFRNQFRWWWRIFRMLRAVDGIIVSTPELKKVYGWMARRVLVFGNYLDLPHWLKPYKANPSDRVRILWAGSTSHTGDLHWIKPIMGKILAKYPQVQFIYLGYGGVPTDDLYARFIYGDDVFEGLPQERRESLLPAPANVYPYIIAGLGADIAIAPLEKNYFNRFKTQCKYLEYAVNGIPGVYAKWFYTDIVDNHDKPWPSQRDLTTGLVADSPQEWIDALSLLIEDATLRHKIGEEARRVAIEGNDFRDYAPSWQGFVESVAACRYPHLTSSHYETEPGGVRE